MATRWSCGSRCVPSAEVAVSASSPPTANELTPSSTPQPDGTLIKALARAWRWQRLLEEGRFASVRDLADAERVGLSLVHQPGSAAHPPRARHRPAHPGRAADYGARGTPETVPGRVGEATAELLAMICIPTAVQAAASEAVPKECLEPLRNGAATTTCGPTGRNHNRGAPHALQISTKRQSTACRREVHLKPREPRSGAAAGEQTPHAGSRNRTLGKAQSMASSTSSPASSTSSPKPSAVLHPLRNKVDASSTAANGQKGGRRHLGLGTWELDPPRHCGCLFQQTIQHSGTT